MTRIIPFLALLIAQVLKFLIPKNKKKFSIKHALDYSGMPSGHASLVIALSTILFLTQGWQSPIFAFSLVLAAIVIRDAIGLRRYLGRHGKILNILIKDLKDDDFLDKKYPHLLENIGHTPTEIAVGALIGFFTSVIGYYILII